MKWKTLSGKFKDIPMHRYLIDWESSQDSKFSKSVIEFLRPYWRYDVVCTQVPVAGKRYTIDYVNVSKKIMIEVDGRQHLEYNEFMHRGSRENYKAQFKRDLFKDDYAEKNGFMMIRIIPDDLPKLSPEWFKEKFGITL